MSVCSVSSACIPEALIAAADQPVDNAEGKDRGREREELRRICFPQIENDGFATDGEQRDHYDRTDLDNLSRRSAITRSDFLNSSAMITVKIMPNTA